MHHAHQKVSRVFIGRLGRGPALRHFSQLVRRMIKLRSPCTQPRNAAILLFPLFRFLLSPDQRILRSRHDRNVGSSDQFQHAQSVRHFRVEPLIARHHRDAQDFRLWRLDQKQHRLLVRSSRSGGILIDDDLSLPLAPST